jgi:hypothetical protein
MMKLFRPWLLPILICLASGEVCRTQTGPSKPQEPASLADELRNMTGKEIHIFYIHGIGSDGPDDFDSFGLRKSMCEFLKDCTTEAGTPIGPWDYANQKDFAPDAPVPELAYLDQPVWKSREEWLAAAPYAIHFQLARRGNAPIYVDELNWWPLTFALKCRQIVAAEADFVGPSKPRIATCSRREPNQDVNSRFKSYDWIGKDEAEALLKKPAKSARVNRALKNSLMDWGFSDAVMALGPLRPFLLEGVRQLILKSLDDSAQSRALAPEQRAANEEFIIVSHSLGSYLIFAALDTGAQESQAANVQQAGQSFGQILSRTSFVFFFANQLRLLELAGLDGPSERNLATHLEAWGKLRCDYLKSVDDAKECRRPRIVALNDPSDLLTWPVPQLASVDVTNHTVKNAKHWFWLFENPTPAHSNYAKHKRAIQEMLNEPAAASN